MDGDIVPPTDEKKRMEYSMELYQSAKNIGALMKKKESKEYDSLWEEEEEKAAVEDPTQIAYNAEAFASSSAVAKYSSLSQSTCFRTLGSEISFSSIPLKE